MQKYQSETKTLLTSAQQAFEILSNLSNVEKALLTNSLSMDTQLERHLKKVTFDQDTVRIEVDMAGTVTFKIIEREPYKTIKFQTENAPIAANLWIQLVEKGYNDTKMRLTIHAEIPTMLKLMVDNKIKSSINKLADAISLSINKLTEEKEK